MSTRPKDSAARQTRRLLWLAEVALLLAYFATRITHLGDLPPHIDEVFHVTRAREVWAGHPLYFINTTKLLNIWLIAAFYPFAAPFWVARIVSVLASLVTVVCTYKLGRLLHSRAAGLLAATLYLVLPLTFWHDRIAISDPIAAATGALVTLTAVRLARRSGWRDAVLVGLSLTAALLSKVTMLLVWPIPALAWVLLRKKDRLARAGLSRLGTAYGVGLVLVSPFILYSYFFSDFAARQIGNRTQVGTNMPAFLLRNGAQLLEHARAYVGVVVLLWLLAAVLVGVLWHRERALYLLAAAAMPIGALLGVGTRNDTRYYLIGLPPLLALMGTGGALAWQWVYQRLPGDALRRDWRLVSGLLLAGLAAAYWPFFRGAYLDVPGLKLPAQDYLTYVSSYPAGFGWDASADWLRSLAAESSRDIEVVAPAEGHAWRTELALNGVSNVEVFHPEVLTADWLAPHLSGGADVYLIRDEPRPALDWDSLGVAAQRAGVFAKPQGQTRVEVYRLTPLESEVAS